MKKLHFLLAFILVVILFRGKPVCAQVKVHSSIGSTPEQVMKKMIGGGGVKISNVKFNGKKDKLKQGWGNQLGTFTNDKKGFPEFFSEGLIICSGDCSVAEGPNNSAGATKNFVRPLFGGQAKCKELEKLVKPYPVNYPAVLEFDFSSVSNYVRFKYVFATEEYPVYSCSAFNDVFGFFVKDSDGGKNVNIALIPGTKEAVSVNNIHPDYGVNCEAAHAEFLTMLPDGSKKMQFNGYVGPFFAEIDLKPNHVYHMTLSISNVSDSELESAVFIEAQSFNALNDIGLVVNEEGVPVEEKPAVVVKEDTLSPMESEADSTNDLTSSIELVEEKPAVVVEDDTLPQMESETVTTDDLKSSKELKIISLDDIKDDTIDPMLYDVTAESDYDYLFDSVTAIIENDSVIVMFHSHGDWCDCFMPKKIRVDVVLNPKKGNSGTRYLIPVDVPVENQRPWLARCLWVLVTVSTLLLFILYLLFLMKKNRFKKNARIKHTYIEMVGSVRRESDEQLGFKLRKKGMVAWMKRWLIPFPDERRTEQINTPPAGAITFVAAESPNCVNITRESFDPDRMEMGDYNHEEAALYGNPKLIEMTDPIRITEKKRYEGQLIYDPGSKNDENGFRTLLGVLVTFAVVSILILLILTIRGLL